MTLSKTQQEDDFFPHLGHTLKLALEKHKMSQRELATRTDTTPAYVSSVINGSRPISLAFAQKLEYALGYKAEQWLMQQTIRALNVHLLTEFDNRPEKEFKIMAKLGELIGYMKQIEMIPPASRDHLLLHDLRRKLQVSSLTMLPQVYEAGGYPQPPTKRTSLYHLYTWLAICRHLARTSALETAFDRLKLQSQLPALKTLALQDAAEQPIQQIMAPCGISFKLLPPFKEVAVCGYLQKKANGSLVMLMSDREEEPENRQASLRHLLVQVIKGKINGIAVVFNPPRLRRKEQQKKSS